VENQLTTQPLRSLTRTMTSCAIQDLPPASMPAIFHDETYSTWERRVPKRDVKATLNFTQEDETELTRVLGCKPAEFGAVLAPYATSALMEYVMMFLGQKVFTRGSDIREYRLLLLIQQVLANHIPDEALVSRLFQSSTSESRALLRAVMSKYQSQTHGAAEQSVRDILAKATADPEGGPWLITLDNTIIVEHLNRVLAETDGTLEKIARNGISVSTYKVTPASFKALCKAFNVDPPTVAAKGARR
jgi:hypothetical protein